MSQEFAPKAPTVVGTESRVKSPDVKLEGSILVYHDLAKKRYMEAIHIAEKIDDRLQTSIPFNKNAIHAASLLAFASLRGAQIS